MSSVALLSVGRVRRLLGLLGSRVLQHIKMFGGSDYCEDFPVVKLTHDAEILMARMAGTPAPIAASPAFLPYIQIRFTSVRV